MRVRRPLVLAAVLALSFGRAARADGEKPDPIDEARGYVGYAPGLVQALSEENRKEAGITRTTGLYVDMVTPGSPGEIAGLQPNDVVLKINGVDIDVSKIGKDDEAAWKKWRDGDFKAVTSKIKPGDKVEMVVERKGKTMTITPTAVSKKQYEELVKAAQDEERFGKVPDPDRAGPANAAVLDFEAVPDGQMRPSDMYVVGLWEVIEEDGKKNHVIRQSESIPSADQLVAIVTGDGRAYADATVSCRVKLNGGMESVSGGILFRVRSRSEGYAAVADGVAKKFSIVAVEKGKPRVVASVPLPSPKLKEWHTLSVTFAGKKLEATFDGTLKVSGEDGAFSSGWAGLTCEKDSESDFDDWKATPAAK